MGFMLPSSLVKFAADANERIFASFIAFGKPLIVAAQGPAIGGACRMRPAASVLQLAGSATGAGRARGSARQLVSARLCAVALLSIDRPRHRLEGDVYDGVGKPRAVGLPRISA